MQLPKEIGDLTNLHELNMQKSAIQKLPEEIGKLTNLRVLNLENSSIGSLSDSIGRIKGLMELNLDGIHISELRGKFPNEFSLILAQRCQSLGFVGKHFQINSEVRYALACNRARFRTRLGKKDDESAQTLPKLWPLMINHATRAFQRYSYKSPRYWIKQPDAIYQLITDGMDSFVGLLVDRNTKDNYTIR